jgi:CRISPR-associated protein Cas1
MTEHLIDIADQPARLKVAHEQIVIASGETERRVPLAEVGALVVSHPTVTYTQAVLAGLMAHGGVFIACDSRHLPVGMMLPLEGHHLHAERLQQQIAASEPTRKRLWQQVVRAKIGAQAALLRQRTGEDRGLEALAAKVRSGDPDNIEAQAARRYWTALFNDVSFRRNQDAPGLNAALNYGYTVLRGIVARAVVAAGLHPALGLHHHNRYDAFALVDDLMEPYRPIVDEVVASDAVFAEPLTPPCKRELVAEILGPHCIEGENRSLFDCAAMTAVSLVKVFQGAGRQLVLPLS